MHVVINETNAPRVMIAIDPELTFRSWKLKNAHAKAISRAAKLMKT